MALLASNAPSPSSVEGLLDIDVEAEGILGQAPAAAPRSFGFPVRAAAALLGAAAVATVGVATLRGTSSPTQARVGSSVGLQEIPSTGTKLSTSLNDYFNGMVFGEKQNSLLPNENMNDKNTCLDDEELSGSLCYRKCSLLTNGTAPYRSSAWTCCPSNPCGFNFNEIHHNIGMCSGFDVAGDGHSCPHEPGACLEDEEMYLGTCYQKCSILTNGEKKYRFGPFTCCATKGMSCFSPSASDSSFDYSSGGGNGDGNAATPDSAHPPMAELTEEGGGSTAAPTGTESAAAPAATPAVAAPALPVTR